MTIQINLLAELSVDLWFTLYLGQFHTGAKQEWYESIQYVIIKYDSMQYISIIYKSIKLIWLVFDSIQYVGILYDSIL